jgi:hypothetical protein
VLAVLPSHIPRERALEEPAAIIMKLQSEYMLQEWTRRLRQSAAQMQSVALWHSRPVLLSASLHRELMLDGCKYIAYDFSGDVQFFCCDQGYIFMDSSPSTSAVVVVES